MKLRNIPRELRSRVGMAVRRAWLLHAQRRMPEAKELGRLESAYDVPDPFRMASPKEQARFVETDRILREVLIAPEEKVGSILEIGCGEGHQSEYLARRCARLTGLDVVSTAVERARIRVPAADLIVGDLYAQPWAQDRGRFDIVTAFEVIYYFRDIPGALATMSRLGRACMITYYRPAAPLVEHPLRAIPLAGRASFSFAGTEWRAAWWRSQGWARNPP
jgi:SAM-dependent methyltransferase